MTTHQGWIATLSTGGTMLEGLPRTGQKTPWQQLIDYIHENDISITRLVLRQGSTRVVAMSHKECDGYFQAYEKHHYWFQEKEILRQGIGSVVGDKVYITWVGDNGTRVIQDVRPLESNLIHTTLRD